jgi:hypothetical protein
MARQPISLGVRDARTFARLALAGIRREYPNKLDHVINSAGEVLGPKALHPAFYGCFDWHSAVHSHWLLVRLLQTCPALEEATTIRGLLNQNLSPTNMAGELHYLVQSDRRTFERTYGWAWLLKLSQELLNWEDRDGMVWSNNLEPLSSHFVDLFLDFLPRQAYPIRTGLHPNSAFALAFALDYARTGGKTDLEHRVIERATNWFGSDQNSPAEWEPSGEDFFSPSLIEADLMQRVLDPSDFQRWFHLFLPRIGEGQPEALLTPATVTDRTDARIVHLDGLNLSRAWCMRSIAGKLPDDDPSRAILMAGADHHAQAALAHVTSGDYGGEHWLGTFAVYLLTRWP